MSAVSLYLFFSSVYSTSCISRAFSWRRKKEKCRYSRQKKVSVTVRTPDIMHYIRTIVLATSAGRTAERPGGCTRTYFSAKYSSRYVAGKSRAKHTSRVDLIRIALPYTSEVPPRKSMLRNASSLLQPIFQSTRE